MVTSSKLTEITGNGGIKVGFVGDSCSITFHLRGNLRICDAQCRDITPSGSKERALLVLLAQAPQGRRPRKWLQDKLWSDRFPDQAATSLRRALYRIRQSDPFWQQVLKGNRSGVWIEAPFTCSYGEAGASGLLEDLWIADPQFQSWLQQLRFQQDGICSPERGGRNGSQRGENLIRMTCTCDQNDQVARQLSQFFLDTLSKGLMTLGDVDIEISSTAAGPGTEITPAAVEIEVDCLLIQQDWQVHLRAFTGRPKRVLWAERLCLPVNFSLIYNGPKVPEFVSRTIAALVSKMTPDRRGGSYFELQRAANLVYSGDQEKVALADRIFERLQAQDSVGVASAWRSYIRLTQVLEFGVRDTSLTDEALEFSAYALRASPDNSLVAALAAQIHMKLAGDQDYGAFLARRALHHNDQNPYAMHSQSQALVYAGKHEAAHAQALYSRQVAASLPHSFCWDLQSCLTALAVGQVAEARDHARIAHLKMPQYRPALRYLIALSALSGQTEAAADHVISLRKVEPGFQLSDLSQQDYPLETLRVLGLGGELASVLPNVPAA